MSYHQALIERLGRQLVLAQSDQYVTRLGEALRSEIAARLPVATGNMASKVLRMGGPARRSGYRTQVWLGDATRLGNPTRAPRGTIAAFLRDHPEYRDRWAHRKQGGFRITSRNAWWILPPEAKAKLQEGRAAGLYGGGYQGLGSSKAAYFYPQEGSQPEWAASAEAAGITPTHFVGDAVQIWTARDVPRAVAQFMSDLARA